MKKWLAIVNPNAGKAFSAERIAQRLLREGLVQGVVVSAAPGDGARHAREARDFEGVVAIGGDGTIAGILAGLDLARQSLAVIPAGHGNCLARDVGAANLRSAFGVMRAGVVRAVDLLRVRAVRADGSEHVTWAASTLAIGYVADVVTLGRQRLAGLGKQAYTVASLFVAPRGKAMRVATDGDRRLQEGLATGVVINNTAHLANFRPFRRARFDDGRLDLMVLERGWIRQVCHNVAVLAGSSRFAPRLVLQASSAQIDLERPQVLMVDGELILDVIRVEAACVPSALRCLAGR